FRSGTDAAGKSPALRPSGTGHRGRPRKPDAAVRQSSAVSPMASAERVGDMEKRVLAIVRELGSATVREAQQALADAGFERSLRSTSRSWEGLLEQGGLSVERVSENGHKPGRRFTVAPDGDQRAASEVETRRDR